jgi:hypothetical protein
MSDRPTMTLAEFEALRPLLGRLAIDSFAVAKAVLVDGERQTAVAARMGMTQQRVHGIVQRFRAASQEVPTGWRRVEVWLPPELAKQVTAIANKARKDYQLEKG